MGAGVNYIKQLNATYEKFTEDNRLNPTHISLYMALFQLWNAAHFMRSFHVIRGEVMLLSKIGSKTTYHRCLKELDYWGYLQYNPSHNPFKGSMICMTIFGTTDRQVMYPRHTNTGTSNEPAVVSINKPIQTLEKYKNTGKHNFIENFEFKKLRTNKTKQPVGQFLDHLKISTDKNYNEPL